jgi:hypothetical protein
MRERETIMLVGIGELGGILLEFLCRIPGIDRIVTADRNEDWGFRKTNSAVLGASYMGLYPDIQFQQIDLLEVEQTAENLKKINPTIIYNGTTLQSWWVVNELPPEVNKQLYRNRCGLGPWESMHLALTSRLMKAVKMAGIDTYVVNTSFPDVTNPSLARVGLAPTVGIGNMDLTIPYIRKTAAEMLKVPLSNVSVEMIAHHFHCYYWCRAGSGAEAPHHLRVFVGKEDVTDLLGARPEFVAELPKHAMRPGGRHGQYLVAASSLNNIMAILNDTGELTHAPGPQGLEGGYPVRLGRKGAEVVVPEGMSITDARALMLEAQQYDGIQEIRGNGDVVLTEEAYTTFKEILDVDCKVVTVEDSLEQARELRAKFEAFAAKYGVAVPH